MLDFAYYSGWRRNEILHLTWDEVDFAGGVIRLAPRRSKTKIGRVLPISEPLRKVLTRRSRHRHKLDRGCFAATAYQFANGGPRSATRVAKRMCHIACSTIVAEQPRGI